ncbi:MAG: HD domain-containing protein, partial [marine benthic group bacterium]|nr:HD domain-containing protein [Gemmatimonadota bacterium]
SVDLVRRFRDWRLVLLSGVLGVMVLRHALNTPWVRQEWPRIADVGSAVPAILVSVGLLVAVILIGRMIEDHRSALKAASAATQALRENQTRLQFVVDQAPVVLWALDNEGLFTLSEGRGLEALGLQPGEVVGRSVFDVYTGNAEVLNDARKALAGHRVRSSVQVGDLVFESRQRPLVDAAGRVVGVLGVAVDVTARERAMTDLEETNRALTNAYDSTLEGWVRALDLRDRETEGHTKRVTKLTVELARRVGVPEEELVHVRRGALLHDIGKIGIPDAVLKKPGPLDEEEWTLMRQHPVWAHEMISAVDFLQPALDIPYCHHERWDGEGYPRGLAGESIPLSARVFAVVDVWDALRSDRPYSEAWDEERVLAHLRDQAGEHFDPTVVEEFLEMLAEA